MTEIENNQCVVLAISCENESAAVFPDMAVFCALFLSSSTVNQDAEDICCVIKLEHCDNMIIMQNKHY